MIRSEFSLSLERPFELSEDDLQSLYDLLISEGELPEISATCIDDTTRVFQDFRELLNYRNGDDHRIVSLKLRRTTLREDYKTDRSEIEFSSEDSNEYGIYGRKSCISMSINMEEDALVLKRKAMLDIVNGTNHSYPWISRIDPLFSLISWFVFIFVITGFFSVRYNYIESTSSNVFDAFKVLNLITYPLILSFFSSNISVRARKRFFPSGVFLLGKQKRLKQSMERAKRGISWTLGVLFSVLATIIIGSFKAN